MGFLGRPLPETSAALGQFKANWTKWATGLKSISPPPQLCHCCDTGCVPVSHRLGCDTDVSGLLILFCWNSWFHFRNWDLSAEEVELWATRYTLCGTSGRITLEALKSVAHSSRCVCAFHVLDWGNLEMCVLDASAFLACLPYPLSLQGPSSPGTACSQINQACLHLPGRLVSCSLAGWVPVAHFGLPGKGGAGRVEGREGAWT